MTYQQKFEELRNAFTVKSDKHIRAHNELTSINGFGDINALDNFARTKMEFEHAGNEYHNFVIFAQKNGLSPNDEFGLV